MALIRPARAVWHHESATTSTVFVRRRSCVGCPAARGSARSSVLSVYPSLVHPFKRYALPCVEAGGYRPGFGQPVVRSDGRRSPRPIAVDATRLLSGGAHGCTLLAITAGRLARCSQPD